MAELCKSCIHTNVCMKDKNIVGDVFVPGNPMLFDNAKLFAKYEERKKAGFPCDDYMPADASVERHGRWILRYTVGEEADVLEQYWECSLCGCGSDSYDTVYHTPYCPNCGARMDGGEDV